MAKRFFYVCAGLFLLALTYHLVARSAGAQAPGNPIVGVAGTLTYGGCVVVLANGDTYVSNAASTFWTREANVFGDNPTSTQGTSWGRVKADFRK